VIQTDANEKLGMLQVEAGHSQLLQGLPTYRQESTNSYYIEINDNVVITDIGFHGSYQSDRPV
jgi:hypothetical protein